MNVELSIASEILCYWVQIKLLYAIGTYKFTHAVSFNDSFFEFLTNYELFEP